MLSLQLALPGYHSLLLLPALHFLQAHSLTPPYLLLPCVKHPAAVAAPAAAAAAPAAAVVQLPVAALSPALHLLQAHSLFPPSLLLPCMQHPAAVAAPAAAVLQSPVAALSLWMPHLHCLRPALS
jgi:hypothetical protein